MIDQYSLKARVYPLLITLFPILILGLSFSIKYDTIITSLSSVGIISLFTYLFSQLGRDLGKKKEKELWRKWGGAPTNIIMQDSGYIDKITRDRYFAKLETLCPLENKDEIENKLKFWTKFLISKTRDTQKFNLLFKENISYGFRRNLFGLKPIGLTVVVIALIFNIVIGTDWPLKFEELSPNWLIPNSGLFILFLFWLLVVNANWVKIPAFGYAERLFESVENLEQK